MLKEDYQHYRVTSNISIIRNGLMRIFDSLSNERIIYVGAPAGFGKTVAVRQWIGRSSNAKAVVSLDEYDNDPLAFCTRFCEALRICQPQNAALSKIISHPAFVNAPEEYTIRAIASLTKRKSTLLVIDDLHFLQQKKVLRLIVVFIKRLPENFRIVLVSRNNPPAGFSDLWLNGDLVRITADNFRFSTDEIVMLYKKRGSHITQRQADEISRFTEGWAIGVNVLSLSGGEPSGEIMNYLDDFIRDNIWERWDEDTREFMLKTAIARELTPSLCAALTGNTDSEDILDRLATQNVFVARIGSSVYRYHQLFRDFLNYMMKARGDDFIRHQWEKAGNWYLSQNNFYDAADCFIKCENYDGIAQSFDVLVNAGAEFFYIDRIIKVAREPIVEKAAEIHKSIYSTLMWAAFNDGRGGPMIRYADLYYQYQPEIVLHDPIHQFNIVLIWLIDFRISMSQLISIAERALGNVANMGVSGLRPSPGTLNQNMPLLHRGTRDFSELAIGSVDDNIKMAKGVFGGLFGEGSYLLAECLLAGLSYEQGRLEKAYSHALAANAIIGDSASTESRFFTLTMMVYILAALGEDQQAEHTINYMGEIIEGSNSYYLNSNYKALLTRFKLRNGDIEAARRWLETHETSLSENLPLYAIYETFTTSRAHIVVGDYNSAIMLLTKLLHLAKTYNRTIDTIETLILLAISYWKKKRGFQKEAMRFLEEAIQTAYKYGYTQLFINEGADLAGMTQRLQRSMQQKDGELEVPVSFIKILYLKMQESQNSGLTSSQPAPSVKYSPKQEMVMKLLSEGNSYKAIAEAMGIKLPTLRSHISLIYKKLEVTNSADAIKKINALGILKDN